MLVLKSQQIRSSLFVGAAAARSVSIGLTEKLTNNLLINFLHPRSGYWISVYISH